MDSDRALMTWIERSYPGAESLAPPGPSPCYLPELHGLPTRRRPTTKNPITPFTAALITRKLTRATQERFGALLSANPDAVLQFRSHSFQDPAVRRYFLQRFSDAGIAPHQLQPFLMPRHAEAMADYGRIHLHLYSSPVSGTTTTLDSPAFLFSLAQLLTTPGLFLPPYFITPVLLTIFAVTPQSCQPMPDGLRIATEAVALELSWPDRSAIHLFVMGKQCL